MERCKTTSHLSDDLKTLGTNMIMILITKINWTLLCAGIVPSVIIKSFHPYSNS
jgi:hypothetical protein